MRTSTLALIGPVLLLAACGKSAASPSAPKPSAVPSGAPGSAAPARPAPDGAALLAAMRQRLTKTQAIEVEVKASSKGNFYGGKRVEAERSSASASRMIWASPTRLRAQVLESTTPMLAGAVLVMTAPSQVRVKGGGALGIVPISMKPSDTRLMTNRNHLFTDNHPVAHLQRLTGPGATWRGIPALPAAPGASWVSIAGVKRLDAEVTEEVMALEPGTMRPAALAMMVGTRPVVTFTFTSFTWDATPPSNAFRL